MLRLYVKLDSPVPVAADAVTPDRLANLSQDEVEKIPLLHGNLTVPLGKVFRAVGLAFEGHVEILGDCSRINNLGRGMTSGRLDIFSDVGVYAGAGMSGGDLEIHGDAGDWLGAEMKGGTIHVHGSAGDCAGAGYRGSGKGMTGGVIRIDGDAGHEIASVLQNGLVVVGGLCGEYAGAGMVAGRVFAFGGFGANVGARMKGGSLVSGVPLERSPTFTFDGEREPEYLSGHLRQLQESGFSIPDDLMGRPVRRYIADPAADGPGELLGPV